MFLGVDPGLQGAIAVIKPVGVEFYDTPTLEMKVNKAIKRQMDAAACALLLSGLTSAHRDDCMVSIEKVQPMPSFNSDPTKQMEPRRSMGATSAFNFGVGFGIWQGICAGLLLPYQLVHPATWKRFLMKDMEKGKDASRVRALQLYPHIASSLSRKKDHGRADALLLAHYGKVTYNSDNFKPFDVPKEAPQLEIF